MTALAAVGLRVFSSAAVCGGFALTWGQIDVHVTVATPPHSWFREPSAPPEHAALVLAAGAGPAPWAADVSRCFQV